jgi:hypothetical protein
MSAIFSRHVTVEDPARAADLPILASMSSAARDTALDSSRMASASARALGGYRPQQLT